MDQVEQLEKMLEDAGKFHEQHFGHAHKAWAQVYATYLVSKGVNVP